MFLTWFLYKDEKKNKPNLKQRDNVTLSLLIDSFTVLQKNKFMKSAKIIKWYNMNYKVMF